MENEKPTFFQMIRSIFDTYTPKDDMITSNEEIDKIALTFHLHEMSKYDLQNFRDMVVMVYSIKIREVLQDHQMDKFDFYNNAMMSITSVIDLYIYNIH